jgi:hypothetical protein
MTEKKKRKKKKKKKMNCSVPPWWAQEAQEVLAPSSLAIIPIGYHHDYDYDQDTHTDIHRTGIPSFEVRKGLDYFGLFQGLPGRGCELLLGKRLGTAIRH